MLKITRPSYVIAETSKAQKEVLNALTDMGYRWSRTTKANEYIPIEEDERGTVINIYPSSHLLTVLTRVSIESGKRNKTELKITDFKPKVILWKTTKRQK